MADITSILLLFALNSIIFGTMIWVYLRVIEKAIDVLMKWHQYDKREG